MLRAIQLLAFALTCLPAVAQEQLLETSPRPLPEVTPLGFYEGQYQQENSVAQTNPMLWQQYQALQVSAADNTAGDSTCGCGNSWLDRCGCHPEIFPWIDGPGNCDSWCVGPKWEVEMDGLFLFQDEVEWNRVANSLAVTPTLEDEFDHALGARLFVTAYNDFGYGMQVGYAGANQWNGTFAFDPNGSSERVLEYETKLNSVEINFLPRLTYLWQFYGGFRYIEIDERLRDFTTVDKVIPPPVSGGTPQAAYVDSGTSYLLENRLIGFQMGGRRDGWRLGRWVFIDTFANAGIYCNKFKREDVSIIDTTRITGDDLDTSEDEFSIEGRTDRFVTRRDYAEIAFAGEAGVSGVVRLNNCLSLRGGYQVMVVDGMGKALDAFFSTDLVASTVLYHGMQFGLEYRR